MDNIPLMNLEFLKLLKEMREKQKLAENSSNPKIKREVKRLEALVDAKISVYDKQITALLQNYEMQDAMP